VSTDQPQPFAHANQTKAAFCLRRLKVESRTGIGNAKIDSITMPRQLNLGLPGSAMLYNIPQSLLSFSKK
jgi:hypothetical protein